MKHEEGRMEAVAMRRCFQNNLKKLGFALVCVFALALALSFNAFAGESTFLQDVAIDHINTTTGTDLIIVPSSGETNITGTLKASGQIWSSTGGFKFPDGTTMTTAAVSGVTGSGTANYLAMWNGAGSINKTESLYWDAANKRLGIGTTAPSQKLEVVGTSVVTQSYGTDVITDGTFSVAGLPNWTLGTGWADGTGTATKNADGTGTLSQALTGLTASRYYKLTYTISSISGGSITAYLVAGTGASGTARSTAGTYTEYLYCNGATNPLTFAPSATGVRAVIDDVSLQLESTNYLSWQQAGKTYSLRNDQGGWPTYVGIYVDGALASFNTASISLSTLYLSSLSLFSAAEYARTGNYWTSAVSNSGNVIKGWFEKLRVNTVSSDTDLEVNNAAGGKVRLTYNDFDGAAANYADMQVTSGGNLVITPSGGNVGIGTTSPNNFKLVIPATGLGSGIKSGYTILGGRSGSNYDSIGYNYRNTATTDVYNYDTTDTSSRLEFTTGGFKFKTAPSGTGGNAITYTDAMTILQGGNVGIGTTAPSYKLHLFGGDTSSTVMMFQSDSQATANQDMRIYLRHYTSTEEPFMPLFASSNNGENYVNYGGGSSAANAATSLRFFTAANQITLTGTERMRIDSTGNVGIGTTSPAEKLHVVGDVRIDGNLKVLKNISNINVQTLVVNGTIRPPAGLTNTFDIGASSLAWRTGYFGTSVCIAGDCRTSWPTGSITGSGVASRLALWTSGTNLNTTENIVWDSTNKRLGIGTASPTGRLDIAIPSLTTNNDGVIINSGNTQSGLYPVLTVYEGASYGTLKFKGSAGNMGGGGIESDKTMILTSGAGYDLTLGEYGSARVTVKGTSGNVGIGTTSPAAQLDVKSLGTTSANNAFQVSNNTGSSKMVVLNNGNVGIGITSPAMKLDVSGIVHSSSAFYVNSGTTMLDSWGVGAYSAVSFNLRTNNINRVTIDSSGNVGIGTTAPNADLHIKAKAGGSNTAVLRLEKNDAVYYADIKVDGNTNFVISNSNAQTLFYGTYGGNVGIGTTGPDAKLHVIGSICAEASDTGCAPTSGYVRGTGLCIGADCRTSWPTGQITGTGVANYLGIWTSATNLNTSNSLFWDNTNKRLGIGTTIPDTPLTVIGTTELYYSSVAGSNKRISSGAYSTGAILNMRDSIGTAVINFDARGTTNTRLAVTGGDDLSTSFAAKINGLTTTGLAVTNAGNVGIGTTGPLAPLHVVGSAFPALRVVRTTSATNTFNSGIYLVTESSGDITDGFGGGFIFGARDITGIDYNLAGIGAVRAGGDQTGDLVFRSYVDGSVSERMRITSTGNVGIGTTAPDTKLSVVNSDSSSYNPANIIAAVAGLKVLNDHASSVQSLIWFRTTYDAVDSVIGSLRESGGNSALVFGTDTLGTGITEKMRITSTGNVGIGTTNPVNGLDIGSNTAGKNAKIYATLGSELITAPMQTAGWTLGYDAGVGGWTINDGTGAMTKTASTSSQSATAVSGMTSAPTAGVTYKVVIVCSAIGGTGSLLYTLGGTSGGVPITATTITDYVTAGTTAKLVITGSAALTATITSISITALTGATGGLTVDGNLRANSPALFSDGSSGYPSIAFASQPAIGFYLKNSGSYVQFVGSTFMSSDPTFISSGGTNIGSSALYFGGNSYSFTQYNSVYAATRTKMYFDSLTDNVGIGTTAPTANFQVAEGTQGVGTVSTVATTALTGSGTKFTNTFKVGDTITVAGETVRTIDTITDDTHLTVSVAFANTASTKTYTLAGGTRFSVLGNGNVGIGTTAPSQKLDVNGNIAITGGNDFMLGTIRTITTGSGSRILIGTSATNQVMGGKLAIGTETAPTNALDVTGTGTFTGNVGIGTTSPAEKLHVVGDVRIDGNLKILKNISNINVQTLVVNGTIRPPAGLGNTFDLGASSLKWRDLYLSGTANAANIKLDNLYDTDGTNFFDNTCTYGVASIDATGALTCASQQGAGSVTGTGVAGRVPVWSGATSINSSESFFWDATNKRLGIGTTAPSQKLHVAGSMLVDSTVYYTDTSYYDNYNTKRSGSSTGLNLESAHASTSKIVFKTGTTPSEVMRIDNIGNVGIGTTSPAVVGSGYTGLDIRGTNGGSLYLATSAGTGKFFLSSSANSAYVFTQDAIPLLLGTSNTEYMRISSTGNVGIGTTAPMARLEVKSSSSTSALPAFNVSNNTNSEKLVVLNNGNVGIGTTSPGAKLEVQTGSEAKIRLTSLAYNSPSIDFVDVTNGNPEYGYIRGYELGLRTNNLTRVYINSNGNVGIGTTSPQTKFDVTTGALGTFAVSLDQGMAIGWRDSSNNLNGASIVGNSGVTGQLYLNSGGSGAIIFQTSNTLASGNPSWGTGASEKMRILSNGNVGIGTASPSSKLHVTGPLFSASSLTEMTGTSVPVRFQTRSDNTQAIFIATVANGIGVQSAQTTPTATDLLLNPFGGNVGIGAAAPTNKLTVSGGGAEFSTSLAVNAPATVNKYGDRSVAAALCQSVSGWSTWTGGGGTCTIAMDSTYNFEGQAQTVKVTQSTSTCWVDPEPDVRDQTSTTYTSTFIMRNAGGTAPSTVSFTFDNTVCTPAWEAYGNGWYKGTCTGTTGGTANNAWDGFNTGETVWVARAQQEQASSASAFTSYIRTSPSASLSAPLQVNTPSNSYFYGGNVGIGTTNPGTKLEVNGAGSDVYATALSGGAGAHGLFSTGRTAIETYIGTSGATNGIITGSVAGDTVIRGNAGKMMFSSAGASAQMTILNGGNVGIGTTAPVQALQVGTNDFVVDSTNHKVGIGITNPSYGALHIYGNNKAIYMEAASTGYVFSRYKNNGGDFYVGQEDINGGQLLTGSIGYAGIITTTGVNALQLGTGNAVRMTILPTSGNVGIGTASPGAKLHVLSNAVATAGIIIENTYTAGEKYGLHVGIPGVTNTGFSLYDYDSSTAFVTVDTTGKVGIGTTAPSAKLVSNVNAVGIVTGLILNNQYGYGSGVGTAATRLAFGRDNSGTGQTLIGGAIDSGNEGETTSNPQYMAFSTKSGTSPYNLTERLRITSAGNVGIGTTTPGALLHTYRTSPSSNFDYFQLGAGTVAHGMTTLVPTNTFGTMGPYDTNAGGVFFAGFTDDTTTPPFSLHGYAGGSPTVPVVQLAGWKKSGTTRTALTGSEPVLGVFTGTSELLRIQANGNVGIGTTTPMSQLEVKSGSAVSLNTAFNVSNNTNSEKLVVLNNGNVGIGTAAPSQKLHLYTNSNNVDTFLLVEADGSNSNAGVIIDRITGSQSRAATTAYSTDGTTNWATGLLWAASGANNNFGISTDGTWNTAKVTISTAGNVGIGTTSPAEKLHVVGDVRIDGNLKILKNISNINVQTLVVNGTIRPPAGLTNTFDIGDNSLTWRNGYFAGNVEMANLYDVDGTNFFDGSCAYGVASIDATGALTCASSQGSITGSGIANYLSKWTGTGSTTAIGNSILYEVSGRIGIGTTNPSHVLHVVGDENITGDIHIKGNIKSHGADFAEMFQGENLLPGDVVCMKEGDSVSVARCSKHGQNSVVGVVSENPTITGNSANKVAGKASYAVGVVGIVKTKVKGNIKAFDLLTTSDKEGYAEKADNGDFGAIIGKAMEDCSGECEINVLVSLM